MTANHEPNADPQGQPPSWSWDVVENTSDDNLTCVECGDRIVLGELYYEDEAFHPRCSRCA